MQSSTPRNFNAKSYTEETYPKTLPGTLLYSMTQINLIVKLYAKEFYCKDKRGQAIGRTIGLADEFFGLAVGIILYLFLSKHIKLKDFGARSYQGPQWNRLAKIIVAIQKTNIAQENIRKIKLVNGACFWYSRMSRIESSQ